jgi:excisionase family DNA binding protein
MEEDAVSSIPTTKKPQAGRLAFSIKEVAALLGISDKSVRRLIARGLLRPSRALRHILISKTEITRFLEQTTSE